MATLAEIRAKLKEQETKSRWFPKNWVETTPTSGFGTKKKENRQLSFPAQMAIKKTLFSEREIDGPKLPGVKGDTDPKTQQQYKYHVWKCMVKLVPHFFRK